MLRKRIFFFCILCTFFYLVGLFLPRVPLTAEVVFASFAPPSPPSLRFFSALPLAPVREKAVPTSTASPTPEKESTPADAEIFEAAPALVNGVYQVQNSAGYAFDADALLAAPFSLSGEKPRVLLYHTHTSEAYTESEGYTYTASDAYRTEDQSLNICRVGEALRKSLEARGIEVVHDTTSHDFPSYSGCYARSLETVEKNLALSGDFDMVIDLHRDAIAGADGRYLKTAFEMDGKMAAQALVIVGTDRGGLPHPNWQKNLSLGLKLQKKLCEMYPGLSRPLHLRTERFNGHVSERALLLEIGACGNTMEEALYTAELVGNAISALLLESAA